MFRRRRYTAGGYLREEDLEREVERLRKRGLGWWGLLPITLIVAIAIGAPFALYRSPHHLRLEPSARAAADAWIRSDFASAQCRPHLAAWCRVKKRLIAAHVTLPPSAEIRDCTRAYDNEDNKVPANVVFPECAAYPLRQRGNAYREGLWVVLSPHWPRDAVQDQPPTWVVTHVFLVPLGSLDQPRTVPV